MQFTSAIFRAYAVDFWGFGASKKNQTRYSIEQQVGLLKGFINQLSLKQVTLVGHGLGSVVGIYFAADFPNIVERMVVVSFPMGVNNTDSRLTSRSTNDTAEWLFGSGSIHKESLEDARKADREATKRSLDDFGEVDWRQLMTRLSIPSLWIYGKNDQAVKYPSQEQIGYLPDHSSFQSYDGSGHFPMLDESKKFNRMLTDFMQLPPGEDPGQMEAKQFWKRRVR